MFETLAWEPDAEDSEVSAHLPHLACSRVELIGRHLLTIQSHATVTAYEIPVTSFTKVLDCIQSIRSLFLIAMAAGRTGGTTLWVRGFLFVCGSVSVPP